MCALNSIYVTVPHRFIDQYRLNKEAFTIVLESVKEHLQHGSIPPVLQLAATLRFLAEGSYQRSVGKDFSISFLHFVKTNFSKVIRMRVCLRFVSDN